MNSRENFVKELDELKDSICSMIDKVYEIVKSSVEALEEHDSQKAKKVIDMDDGIDKEMEVIEERAIELIALQQPAAKDLRILFSAIKIVTDLERMGDYCVNIAKEVILIGKEEHIKDIKEIVTMKEIILDMITDTKESFLKEDAYEALKVGKQDSLLDELYREMYNEMLLKINENKDNISQGARLLFVGRYLERIGDHLTNVCEKIIYIIKGERVEIN